MRPFIQYNSTTVPTLLYTIVVEPTATERSTAIAQGQPELKDGQVTVWCKRLNSEAAWCCLQAEIQPARACPFQPATARQPDCSNIAVTADVTPQQDAAPSRRHSRTLQIDAAGRRAPPALCPNVLLGSRMTGASNSLRFLLYLLLYAVGPSEMGVHGGQSVPTPQILAGIET